MVPLIASDLKFNLVPGCKAPVFVMVNDGLAVIGSSVLMHHIAVKTNLPETPRSHPETKAPAIART